MNFTVSEQLFRSSVSTSEVIDMRDAYDFSVSVVTSAGTTAQLTTQVSNWTGSVVIDGDPPEESWISDFVASPSAGTVINPPLGYRYFRMLKGPTGTFTIRYNKHVR